MSPIFPGPDAAARTPEPLLPTVPTHAELELAVGPEEDLVLGLFPVTTAVCRRWPR